MRTPCEATFHSQLSSQEHAPAIGRLVAGAGGHGTPHRGGAVDLRDELELDGGVPRVHLREERAEATRAEEAQHRLQQLRTQETGPWSNGERVSECREAVLT